MRWTARGARIPRRVLIQAGLGVALVGVSILGVALLLDEGDRTRTVALVVTDTPEGTGARDIGIEWLEIPARFSAFSSLDYNEWESLSGTVSNRSLRSGDVLSSRDFSFPLNSDLAGITIELSIGQPIWLASGQRVTLWVAPPVSENSFSAPFILSSDVLIESISKEDGFAANGAFRQVHALVPTSDVPSVVHALSNSYFLYLVPEN